MSKFTRFLSTLLAVALLSSVMAFCAFAEADTVTVNTVYCDVEVPFAPERVCVLDMYTMDTLHTLDLSDNVVILLYNKKHPAYLADYYASETIISLNASTRDLEEGADPYEPYYSIDADLIIGTVDQANEELYNDVLSQIAPTVILPAYDQCETGMFDGVMANAATIAGIWGAEEELEAMTADRVTAYAQLKDICAGKTYLLGYGDIDINGIRLDNEGKEERDDHESEEAASAEKTESSSESSNSHHKKSNSEAAEKFLAELGMVNITGDAPAEFIGDLAEGADHDAAAKSLMDWVESVNPDALLLTSRDYFSLEEVRAAGYDYLYLDSTTVYNNGGFQILGVEWSQCSGGLTGMLTMVDQVAEIFLK